MATKNCPICDRTDARVSPVIPLNAQLDVACPSCGKFFLQEAAEYEITQAIQKERKARPVLMHALRKMQQSDQPIVTSRLVKQIIEERDIPTAREQVDNILIWIGDNSAPGIAVPYEASELFPVIGAYQPSALMDLVRNLDQEGFLDTQGPKLILKLKGWDRYWELKRGRSESKKAFMAMPYGNAQVEAAFATFKTEVKKTGFLLYRLDESPKAGLIDNRLRVEIRTSRFLVVDLTNENRGAYWEAGFAEGLNKPVFYTCEQSFFHEHGTHFDTNHLHTILWDPVNIRAAGEALKITIRATLPAEAKMND